MTRQRYRISFNSQKSHRIGTWLLNSETGEMCYGLAMSNHGMVATTVTTKGEFWNGVLHPFTILWSGKAKPR